MNNAAGLLKIDGTGTLQATRVTTASNPGKGLAVNASSTISSLTVSADTKLNIARLEDILSGSVEVAANKTLSSQRHWNFRPVPLTWKAHWRQEQTSTVSGAISVADNATVFHSSCRHYADLFRWET